MTTRIRFPRQSLTRLILSSGAFLPIDERVVLRLIYLADPEGVVTGVSEAQLVASLGSSERSLRTALNFLQGLGCVERQRPRYPRGGETATYQIDAGAIEAWCKG